MGKCFDDWTHSFFIIKDPQHMFITVHVENSPDYIQTIINFECFLKSRRTWSLSHRSWQLLGVRSGRQQGIPKQKNEPEVQRPRLNHRPKPKHLQQQKLQPLPTLTLLQPQKNPLTQQVVRRKRFDPNRPLRKHWPRFGKRRQGKSHVVYIEILYIMNAHLANI